MRLCDRELKEIIAEWPFVTNIDALEVSPAGDRFAVITSKRLEVYWLPPVDETAPEWFPSLMRHLAYRKQTPAEQIAVLAALEKQISRATPGNDQAPRLLESVRWALADTRLRPVLPGMAMKLADQFEDILPRADAVLRQRLLNKLIVQGVRTAAIYREAARHPPEGMSAESLKKWGDYYNSLADDFKSAEPAKADQPLSPPRQRQVRLPADKPAWVDTRSPRWQFEKAEVFIQKSTFLRARKQPEDAAKNAEAGLTIMQRLTEQEPQNTKWAASLATCHHKLGMALRDQKDLAKAELHFQKASQIMARLISQDPKQNEWLHKLASINSWQASNALDQENWKDASRFWDGAARAYEQILALDPEDNAAKLKVADYLNLMAISLGRQGRHAEAVVVVKRSLAILEELGAANQLTGDSIHWLQRARNDLVSFQKALEVKSSPQKTKL